MKRRSVKLLMLLAAVLVLVTAAFVDTPEAWAADGYPASVSVNGGITLNSSTPYWSNGNTSASASSSNWNAYYNTSTGELQLKNYEGKSIRCGSAGKSVRIIVIGDCHIDTTSQFGIDADGTSLEITSSSLGTLVIDQNDQSTTSGGAGIAVDWNSSSSYDKTLTFSGNVTVLVNSYCYRYCYGLSAKGDISISDKACVDINAKYGPGTTSTSYAVLTSNKINITTYGHVNFSVAARDEWKSPCDCCAVYAMGGMNVSNAEYVSVSAVKKDMLMGQLSYPDLSTASYSGFTRMNTLGEHSAAVFFKSYDNYGGAFPVTGAFFPDPSFRAYVTDFFDTDKDGWLDNDEVADATYIEVYASWADYADYSDAYTLKGIEYLGALDSIYWDGEYDYDNNKITAQCYLKSIDLSNNPALTYVSLRANMLEEFDLDAEKLPNLEAFDFSHNNFQIVDIEDFPKLEAATVDYCYANQLYVKNCPKLLVLSCDGNNLESVGLKNLPIIRDIYARYNEIDQLDLSAFPSIKELYLDDNALEKLDLSKQTKLNRLNCSENALKSLDLSKTASLLMLDCSNNEISDLKLGAQSALMKLFCYGNDIKELDISNCERILSAYKNGTHTAAQFYEEYKYPENGSTGWLRIDGTVKVITENAGIPVITSVKNGGTNTGITINWTASTSCTKFRVQRQAEGEGGWTTVTDSITAQTYTDKGAKTGGVNYNYRVSGYNGSSWTNYSDPVSIVRNPFTDVKNSASYFKALMWAYNNGIVAGTSTTKFSPNDNCTRGQFALMLWRMNGKPDTTGLPNPFKDVSSSNGFYKGIVWCYSQGITAGTSATTYSPNDNIKRWQMILMFWRMQGKPASSLTENPFTDVKTTASYYKAALWAYEKGITGVKTFMPNDLCTRWQLVLFLYRLNNLYHYI